MKKRKRVVKIYKVVCVDNKPRDLKYHCISNARCLFLQSLTIGKIYETVDCPESNDICVFNDKFLYVNYSAKRFISLEEWRNRKINEILNEL